MAFSFALELQIFTMAFAFAIHPFFDKSCLLPDTFLKNIK